MRFSNVLFVIILFILIFTILFGILSFAPSLRTKPILDKKKPPPKTPDPPTCVTLHRWTKVSFWVFLALAILFVIVFPLKEIYFARKKRRSESGTHEDKKRLGEKDGKNKGKKGQKENENENNEHLLQRESIIQKNEKYRKEEQIKILAETYEEGPEERGLLESFFNFLVFLGVIAYLVGYIGLWRSWFYNEECFTLRKISFFYLLFIAVLAGLLMSIAAVWQGLKDGGMGWMAKSTQRERLGDVWENI
jgi:hypothetical protein